MAYTAITAAQCAVGYKWDEDDFLILANNFIANVPDIFTTKGDIAYASGADALTRLGVGTDGQVLGVSGGAPAWLSGKVHVGMIIIWSGSVASIPTGWQLCNGTNGTPDLRDRFVIGAGSTYAVDASGGAATIDLEHAHTPAGSAASGSTAHTHTQGSTGNESAHTHTDSGTTGGPSSSVSGKAGSYSYPTSTHTHSWSGSSSAPTGAHSHSNPNTDNDNFTHGHTLTSTANGLSSTQSVLPTYYALAFIQRTS